MILRTVTVNIVTAADTPTETGERYPYWYDEIILVDDNGNEYVKPPSRPNRRADPNELADWHARAYPHIRAQREAAQHTPFDDALPSEPLEHLDELRAALRELPSPTS